MQGVFFRVCSLFFVLAIPLVAELPDSVWEDFASEDDDQIQRAVELLVERSDKATYRLLNALYDSKLFVWEERELLAGVVVGGEPEETESGDEFLPISTAYPESEPIVDEEGNQRLIDIWDLIPVETNRTIRVMIEAYRSRRELRHPDAAKRLRALEDLATKNPPGALAVLRACLPEEKDPEVAKAIEIAILRVQLVAKDPLDRFMAAQGLGKRSVIEMLPAVEARLDPKAESPETDARVLAQLRKTQTSLQNWKRASGIAQTIFFGISLGSILILMALGLAIIYGLLGVINMAHGEFMMLGAYTAYVVYLLFQKVPQEFQQLAFWAAFPASFLVAGGIGVLVEMLIIRHLYDRPLESLLATWGLGLIMIQAVRKQFGDNIALPNPEYLAGGIELLPGVVMTYSRLFVIALTIVMIVAMFVLLNRTNLGMRIRAVTQNRSMSACLGIRTRSIDRMAFFLGTGIAGIAGCGITLIGNIVPNMGQNYIVDSFLVVVTGGVGKLIGTVLAGLSIGLTSKVAEPMMGAVLAKVLLLALIIVFLQIRPTGLFPAKGRNADQ